jgi:ABC-2 type transport system ATP-binding protein
LDRPPTGHCVPLVATGVRKRYGTAVALAGVDLDVRAGTIAGIVGPNGSGKTTLLNAVAGLVALDAGTIEVAGSPAGSRLARAASALVPDDPAGLDELTVEEHIALVHALWRPGVEAATRAEALLSAFGLEPRRRQRLGTLSRGLRRQASAVAAFSLAPPLLLVDEATATLDPEAVVVLGEALATLAGGGCGVLLATQDLHFAGAVCDELLLLDKGAVADRGEPAALCARHEAATLEEAFLAAVGEIGLRERIRSELAAL